MKLPKLNRVVSITFWSLRNGIGSGMGVIHDVDTQVKRKARRVICEDGWKWQLFELAKLREYDYFADVDQEILTEYGSDIDAEWSGEGD